MLTVILSSLSCSCVWLTVDSEEWPTRRFDRYSGCFLLVVCLYLLFVLNFRV